MISGYVCATLALSLLPGAGDARGEQRAREFLKTAAELTTTLKGVKDRKSAESVKARVLATFKRLQELERKVNALGPAEQRLVQKKYGEELASLLPTFFTEAQRIKMLPGVLEIFRNTALLWDFFGESRGKWARADLVALTRAVEAYHARHAQLPAILAALTKKAEGMQPFLDAALLLDPWGRPYVYEPATLDPVTGRPLIYSRGAEPNAPEGRIRNWDPPKKP